MKWAPDARTILDCFGHTAFVYHGNGLGKSPRPPRYLTPQFIGNQR